MKEVFELESEDVEKIDWMNAYTGILLVAYVIFTIISFLLLLSNSWTHIFFFLVSIVTIIFFLYINRTLNRFSGKIRKITYENIEYCTECGSSININAKFCPECGTKVE